MKKVLLLATLAVAPTVAIAQNSPYGVVASCDPQWQRVINGRTYCLLGEPYYTDPTVILDGRYGAPIARPVAVPNSAAGHGASPYSGRGH